MKLKISISDRSGVILRLFTLLAMLIFIIGLYSPATLTAADKAGKKNKPTIYDPDLDVKAAIKSSMDKAKKENKHILLMFGANWCPWCHKLHGTFKSNEAIKSFLKKNFILVMVDIGETKDKPLNRDLVAQFGVKGMGYPSLAVLDYKARLLASQNSGTLEKGKQHDPERVMGFLKANSPQEK